MTARPAIPDLAAVGVHAGENARAPAVGLTGAFGLAAAEAALARPEIDVVAVVWGVGARREG